MRVSIAEARREFTKLVQLADRGEEEIIVTKRGKPTVVLVPYEQYEQFLRLQADLKLDRLVASLRGRGLRARELYEESRAQLEERPYRAEPLKGTSKRKGSSGQP
jgi:prevent-host-death family protein